MRYRPTTLFIPILAVLAAAWPTPVVAASATPPAAQGGAVAIVFSRTLEGTSTGNGFFVGDGSLIVTARHVVYPTRPAGLHRGEAMVTVLSPYLGQAAEVHVVARDDEANLVLLRGPWPGHPAFALADEGKIAAAEAVDIAGYAQAQSLLAAGTWRLLKAGPSIDAATMDVEGVTVRRAETQGIVTRSPPPGPGWAGAPIFVGGTHEVAGCFTRTQANGTAGSAVAAGRIRRLIAQAGFGVAGAADADVVPLPAAKDASVASIAYLRGASASIGDEPEAALASLQEFVKLRPASAVGHRDAAGQLRALGRLDEAQDTYARALAIEPMNVSTRVLYGQLLVDRVLPKSAEEHLRFAWERGTEGNAAVIPLCNLLSRQSRDVECLELLDAALDRNPSDGHLWNYVGQSRRAMNDHAAAATAFARAADLLPDVEVVRVQAAEQFEAAGQSARAEEQYAILVELHPASAAAHYRYARFVARDANRRDEALRRATQALELADAPGAPPKAMIQSLIAAIRSRKTSKGDDFHL